MPDAENPFLYHFSPSDTTVKPKKIKNIRRFWATLALILSLVAVALEASLHLCASMLFDPLPDIVTGIAYTLVIFFLWFNEATLAASRLDESGEPAPTKNPLVRRLGAKRAATLALAGTPVALLVAVMATWMFLPFLPLAPVLVLTLIGALVYVPLLDSIVLLTQLRALRHVWREQTGHAPDRRVTAGTLLLMVVSVFFLIVRPALIGRWTAEALHTTGTPQQRAFQGLRSLIGQRTLLDLTYRRNPAYWVCLGYNARTEGAWPWVGYFWKGMDNDETRHARRTYFLLTGSPYQSVPRPASAARQNPLGGPDDVAIEETGGYNVGRIVPGLSLQDSALHLSANAQTETSDGAWTLTFRNDTGEPQEARADILLPPGGTCHAVSLWVNGVEKPAAFGAPQKVRAAYQEVAVVRRRDPLLVTMPAPDHLLAQCFPVPAHGTMKIKLGITAPLAWHGDESREALLSLPLPFFGPVNFDVPASLTHHVTRSIGGATTHEHLSGNDLFTPQSVPVASTRNAPRVGDTLALGVARTSDPLALPSRPVDLWFVLDASQGMNNRVTNLQARLLRETLADLPVGSRIFFADTKQPLQEITRRTDDLLTGLEQANYVGGTDPGPALTQALRQARNVGTLTHPSAVVFLHAASPSDVTDFADIRRELQRGVDGSGPAFVSVQLAPRAQDAVAMELSGFAQVYARRALPGSDDGALSEAIRFAAQAADAHWSATPPRQTALPLGGRFPAVNGIGFVSSPAGPSNPLTHLFRHSASVNGWYAANTVADDAKPLDLRIAAGQPAAAARLVTPLSSAVVLETREQYEKHGLDDKDGKKGYTNVKGADLPVQVNAPEPASALLLGIGLFALRLLRRRAR